jgi:hypothetical protein
MRLKSIRVVLFVLAVAVQVIAPVLGGMAFADERSRGEAVSLCSAAAGDTSDAPSLPTHHDRCALCQITCDGYAPVGLRAYPTAPAGSVWSAIVWASREFVLPTTSIDHLRRARAPPSFS